MDEFKFVFRCFGFAILLLVLTQIKAGDTTIEGHIQASLLNSKVSNFVNKVAAGGVKLLRDGFDYTVEYYRDWKRSETSVSPAVVETEKVISKSEPSTEELDTEPLEFE